MDDSNFTILTSPDDSTISEISTINASNFTVSTNPTCNFDKFIMIFENMSHVESGIDIENREFKINYLNLGRYLQHIVEDINDLLSQLGITPRAQNTANHQDRTMELILQNLTRIEAEMPREQHFTQTFQQFSQDFERRDLLNNQDVERRDNQFRGQILEEMNQLRDDVRNEVRANQIDIPPPMVGNDDILGRIENQMNQIQNYCQNPNRDPPDGLNLDELSRELTRKCEEYSLKIEELDGRIEEFRNLVRGNSIAMEDSRSRLQQLIQRLENLPDFNQDFGPPRHHSPPHHRHRGRGRGHHHRGGRGRGRHH